MKKAFIAMYLWITEKSDICLAFIPILLYFHIPLMNT